MILATWQGLPASLLQGWARKGVYPDGCGRPGTGRVAPFATYSNMSISQYTRLMCISYGVPGKDRVNFMSVFQIGVKLIALQGERMGVVLGRLLEPRRDAEGRGELQNCFFIHEGPRRDTKDTFLSAENCFFHGGTRRTSFYPRRTRRGAENCRTAFLSTKGREETLRTPFCPRRTAFSTKEHGGTRRTPFFRLQSYAWLIGGWHRLTSTVRNPRVFWSSLFPVPILANRDELDGQSLRALDHAAPACPRLWTDMTGHHSVGLETVDLNIGTILAQKQARITR